MERLFSPQIYKSFVKNLDKRKEEMNYFGDISDFGNEIGLVIGDIYPNISDIEMNELIMGLRHGISVTSTKPSDL